MTPPLDLAAQLEQHAKALRQLANALLRDPAAADDAVQDACVAALQHPPRHGAALGGWLATLLRNAVRGHARRDRRRAAREHVAALARAAHADDPAAAFARAETAHRLITAVQQLDAPYRTAIWQRWFEGLTPRAIARARGVPVETVKSWLKRGLAMLRARLGGDGGDGGDGGWRAAFASAFGLGEWARAAGSASAVGTATGGVLVTTATKTFLAAAVLALALTWWWPARDGGAPPASPGGDSATPVAAAPAAGAGAEADADASRTLAANATIAAPLAPPAADPASPRAPGVVRGRAVDDGTNAPLARVVVRREPRDWQNPVDAAEVVTAADGRFEMPARVDGVTSLLVRRADRVTARWSQRVVPGDVVDLGDVAMRAGRVLSGRVVDRDGGPIEPKLFVGCDFPIRSVGACRERQAPAYTEELGAFTTEEPVPLGITTRWSIPFGDVMLAEPLVLTIRPEEPREVVLVAQRRPRITGVFVDTAGVPVANVGFGVQPGWPDARGAADGSFTLLQQRPSPAATIHVVECAGWAPPQPLRDVPWGTTNVRIVLDRLPPVAIEVRGGDDGAPVEQFGVILRREGGLAFFSGTVRQRGTHERGRLDVTDVVRGRTELAVVPVSPRWEPSAWHAVGDAAAEPLRVDLVPRRRLPVVVTRAGAPVAGAVVELVREVGLEFRPGRPMPPDPSTADSLPVQANRCERIDRTATDTAGRAGPWAPAELAPVVLCVRVTGEPPLMRRDLAWPRDGASIAIELPALGELRPRVDLRGHGRDSVRLVLPMAHDSPHEDRKPLHDGSLQPVMLHAGPQPYEWQRLAGGWRTFASGTVDVVAGATTPLVVDLDAHALGSVRGTVQAAAALPGDLAVVLLRFEPDNSVVVTASAPVAADGTFAAAGVPPGRYRVAFGRGGASPGATPAVQPDELVVVAGSDAAVALRYEPRRLVVSFVRADGQPVRGVRVLTRCADTTWPAFRVLTPTVDGELVLDPAPAVPVAFREWTESVPWSEPVAASPGTTTVTVVLPAAR